MRKALALLVVSAAFISSVSARADVVGPCPPVGTEMKFTAGKITFKAQDGDWCTGTDFNGHQWRRAYGGLVAPGTTYIDKVRPLFPLKVGNKVEFQVQGTMSQVSGDTGPGVAFWYTHHIEVTRQEKIVSAGGTF